MADGELSVAGRGFVAVAAASNALGRLVPRRPGALDVLDALDQPVPITAAGDIDALARAKRLELLRIAARDLLGLDGLGAVGRGLADMADAVLRRALDAGRGGPGAPFSPSSAWASSGAASSTTPATSTCMFVAGRRRRRRASPGRAAHRRRGASGSTPTCAPRDAPGPLSRSLSSYRSYWERWAATWEFQALLKARPVGGGRPARRRLRREAAVRVWGRTIRRTSWPRCAP